MSGRCVLTSGCGGWTRAGGAGGACAQGMRVGRVRSREARSILAVRWAAGLGACLLLVLWFAASPAPPPPSPPAFAAVGRDSCAPLESVAVGALSRPPLPAEAEALVALAMGLSPVLTEEDGARSGDVACSACVKGARLRFPSWPTSWERLRRARVEPARDTRALPTSVAAFERSLRDRAAAAPDGSRRQPTCAVLGNGACLLSREDGAEIDGYDLVVRLNGAETDGFEAHVGARTSMRLYNHTPRLDTDSKNDSGVLEVYSYGVFAEKDETTALRARRAAFPGRDMALIHPDVFCAAYDMWGYDLKNRPTLGVRAGLLALRLCSEAKFFGFCPVATGLRRYFGESMPSPPHDTSKEERFHELLRMSSRVTFAEYKS